MAQHQPDSILGVTGAQLRNVEEARRLERLNRTVAELNEQTRIADEASERRLHDEARDDHEHDWLTR